MYRLVEFDGITLPQASVEAEVGTAASQPAVTAYRGGVVYADNTRAPQRLPYELSMRCELLGADLDALRSTLDALRAKRGVYGRLYREGLNDPGHYQWAQACLLQVPEMRNARNVYYHPLTLVFLILTPWHGTTRTLQADCEAINGLGLYNAGSLPITQSLLTITCSVNITHLRLYRDDGATDISYTATIPGGTTWTLDTATWTVTNNGVIDVEHLHFNASHRLPDLIQIEPGGSTYILTQDSGAMAHVVWQYDELYE